MPRLSIRVIARTHRVAYAFRSLFFGRSEVEPHLRQVVARIALRALHFMQTFTLRSLASASGNLMYE